MTKITSAKIQRFVLNEQLPDVRVVGPRKGVGMTDGATVGSSGGTAAAAAAATTTASSSSSKAKSTAAAAAVSSVTLTTPTMAAIAVATAAATGSAPKDISAADHVTQLALETCRCCHLDEYLPHLLDWELCRTVRSPRGYAVANPVHALHLVSQVEEMSLSSSEAQQQQQQQQQSKQPPLLYGEEQQRKMALSTEGIVETWCPLDAYSAVIHDDTALQKTNRAVALQNRQHAQQQSKQLQSPKGTKTKNPAVKAKSPPAVAVATTTTTSTTTKLVEAEDKDDKKKDNADQEGLSGVKPETPSSSLAATSAAMEVEPTPDVVVDGATKTEEKTTSDSASAAAPTETKDNDKVTAKHETVPSTAEALQGSGSGLATLDVDKEDSKISPVASLKNDNTTTTAVSDAFPTAVKSSKSKGGDDDDTDGKMETEVARPLNSSNETSTMQDQTDESKDQKGQMSEPATKPNAASDAPPSENADGKREDPSKEETILALPSSADIVPSSQPEHEADGKMDQEKKETRENVANITEASAVSTERGVQVTGEQAKADPAGKRETSVERARKDDPANASDEASGPNSVASGGMLISPQETSSIKDLKVIVSPGKTAKRDEGNVEPAVVHSGLLSRSMPPSAESPRLPKPTMSPTAAVKAATAPPLLTSSTSTPKTAFALIVSSPKKSGSDPRMIHLHLEEDRIRIIRRSLKLKRVRNKKVLASKDAPATKKLKREPDTKVKSIPGLQASALVDLDLEQEEEWKMATLYARETAESWMDRFRLSQQRYWHEKELEEKAIANRQQQNNFYHSSELTPEIQCCQACVAAGLRLAKKNKMPPKRSHVFAGDELMQCLECSVVGCGPPSVCQGTRNHMLQHLLLSGHKFAVTIGERAQIFCFRCGDFVYHEVFEQEQFRIACARRLPWMAWKEHAIVRSFDAFQFLKTQDHGIVWRGLVATYPPLVPREHYLSAQLTMNRKSLFEGRIHEQWLLTHPNAVCLTATQHNKERGARSKIAAPVGMYNLGNTCFMSSILQCLVFCEPFQHYFLNDVGHHHQSCQVYREIEAAAAMAASKSKEAGSTTKAQSTATKKKPGLEICMACEMDRLLLSYLGSATGVDWNGFIQDVSRPLLSQSGASTIGATLVNKGDPLNISDLLTCAWKCGGMNHLAGYDQRDAHEFLSAFLETIGMSIVKYRERVYSAITRIDDENAVVSKSEQHQTDIVKHLFEGSLRSVLLCEKCGVKRLQEEPFMNISLSLSEEVERMQQGKGRRNFDIHLETCLEHFVLPEELGDLVHCVSCAARTQTRKQHTFSKLPKILCLHLKRFDAARNQKIDEFVSFPAHGLNLGGFLPQWREVSRVNPSGSDPSESTDTTPTILYDLFGTVNHIGSMQSGHYVSNVKTDSTWYHCNDQHVGLSREEDVLKSPGAYLLFYQRR